MKIILEQAGKRYGSEWIFKNVNYTFESDNKYALIGPNGSGRKKKYPMKTFGHWLVLPLLIPN